jgi:hypothetical protein
VVWRFGYEAKDFKFRVQGYGAKDPGLVYVEQRAFVPKPWTKNYLNLNPKHYNDQP